MRPRGTPDELERRRTRGIALLQEGYQPVEVAHMVGVDRRSVRRWNAAYRAKGKAGLKKKAVPGRPLKLDGKARERLERVLLRGAKKAGFETDLWTCPRIAEVIEERFGVDYHVDHVCRLLHGLGWSPQKPQRRAIERDEDAIEGWVKHQWPRIKKKPRA